MIYKKILLKNEYKILKDSNSFLEIFCYDKENIYAPNDYKRYPLLIIPGGGYFYCATREKDPIAFAFLAQGFNCFTLTYTCKSKYPTPQLELACAMDYIEKHADELGIVKNYKSLIGFSAGGHLSASYCCYYKELARLANLNPVNIEPKFQILSYPVISTTGETHEGTKSNITNNESKLIEKMSIEKHVTKNYPTTYIWTTKEDEVVPISNSINFYNVLKQKGIKTKLHLYQHGSHGRSIATNETEFSNKPLKKWMIEMQDWVKESTEYFYKNTRNNKK